MRETVSHEGLYFNKAKQSYSRLKVGMLSNKFQFEGPQNSNKKRSKTNFELES